MRTGGTTHVDPGDLQAWFSQAGPGDTLIYAIGSIGADRCGFGSLLLVAAQALQWQSNGYVFLFQRRIPRMASTRCSNIE